MSDFPLSLLINQVFHIDTERGVTDMSQSQSNNQALYDLLSNLSSGETILGKIVSSDDNSYTFKTDNNITISARAEKGVSLEPGSSVLFEVKKTGNTFSLRPLSTNLNASKTAAMALNQAGLPVNNRSLEMTVRNMEYGNPIDRQSLQESYKDVALNPTTPVKYIVDLQEMNIPVTKDNLAQYEAYINSQHSVGEAFNDIASSMATEFADKIEMVLRENPEISEDTHLIKLLNVLTNENADNTAALPGDISKATLPELVKALNGIIEDTRVSEGKELEIKESLAKAMGYDSNRPEYKEEQQIPALKSITTLGTYEELRDKLEPVLKDIFLKTLTKDFSVDLKGENIKGEIKDLYDKLYGETKRLTKALEDAFPKESVVFAKAQTLSSNMDFMNSLNNYIPYIQIPFASQGATKAGDLYVYKNNKGLSDPEGELSAFVHLDTDNLGSCDVLVKLKNSNVSTHFTLQDEESLDFIEAHLDFLNKRLSDKGYVFSASFEQKEKEKSIIEEMLEVNSPKILVAKRSFDARV